MTIYASTPATGSARHKGPGRYLAAGVGYGRIHGPNPILVDMRKTGRIDWADMLHTFEYVTSEAGHYITGDWGRITDPGQIDHARRVLTRLARFQEHTP